VTEDQGKPKILLDPAQLTTREEYALPVLARDWKRLRRLLDEMPQAEPWYREAEWGTSGFALAALFALVAWLPVHDTLDDAQRVAHAWISPLLFIATVSFVIVTVVIFFVNRTAKDARKDAAASMSLDMDELFPMELLDGPRHK
jgi:hypothetical protein